jgi:hypothetical protein
MSILTEATSTLRAIESELLSSDRQGCGDVASMAQRIHRVVDLLSSEDAQWVGTTEAKRLLGVSSENTVKAWARLGLLRSRTLPNGRIQVLLDDVLQRRAENEELMAIGGDEFSPDELRILRETRPGTNPWQREKTGASQ